VALKGIFLVLREDVEIIVIMILIDTSVWVNHLRKSEPRLQTLLLAGEVYCHPFIIGELACGSIKNRQEIISLLQSLPSTRTVNDNEFLYFIEQNKIYSKGIGYVDIHLLASTKLESIKLWTEDKRLKNVATTLGLSYIG